MPSTGRCWSSSVKASSPPAEAPIPTTWKEEATRRSSSGCFRSSAEGPWASWAPCLGSGFTGGRSAQALEGDDPALEGEAHQIGAAPEAQLPHEVRAVALRRSGTDEEPSGDLAAGQPLGHEVQHLALPRREGVVGIDP